MESVFIAALLAASPIAANVEADAPPSSLDVSCFQLMAELADDENPQTRTVARTAAQYFLGRIDASMMDLDLASVASPPRSDRPELLRRCGAVLDASGRDFEALGRMTDSPVRPSA
jgi:hypothetical protein